MTTLEKNFNRVTEGLQRYTDILFLVKKKGGFLETQHVCAYYFYSQSIL